MMQLSIQKFSSNVVEKLFCSAPPDFRARFIAELIESEKMSVLVNSNYGHYVVRRALQLAEPPQVQLLLAAIRGNVGQLPNRRLRAKWEKVMSVGNERLADASILLATANPCQDAVELNVVANGWPKGTHSGRIKKNTGPLLQRQQDIRLHDGQVR